METSELLLESAYLLDFCTILYYAQAVTRGAYVMKKDKHDCCAAPGTVEPEKEGHALLNIGKIVFLIAVLVAAWFLLERLIERK